MNQLLLFSLNLSGLAGYNEPLPQLTAFVKKFAGSILYVTDDLTNNQRSAFLRETANSAPVMLYDVRFPLKNISTSIQIPQRVIIDAGKDDIGEKVKFLHQNVLWDPRSQVIVLTKNEGNAKKEWLKELWGQTKAVNVLIWEYSGNSFRLFTWFPYQLKECSNVTTITEIQQKEKLFPVKIPGGNLNHCSLKIIAYELPPFSAAPSRNFSSCSGLDVNVLRTYLQKYSLTPDFMLVPWTEFYLGENGFTALHEPSGAIKMLYEGEREFGYGGIQARDEFTWYTQILKYHFSDTLSWFGPVPEKISSIDKFSMAFSGTIWLLVSLSFFLVVTTVALEALKISDSRNVLHATGAFLNAAVAWPKGTFMKCLFLLIYLFSLHITTFYQSSLIYLLGHQISQPGIHSVDEALERNFHLFAGKSMRHLFGPTWKYLENDQLHFVAGKPDYTAILKAGNGVFLNPRATTGNELRLRGITDAYGRPLTVEVGYFMAREIAMLATPGHPLIPLFEATCQQLLEGGFTRLWYEQTQYKLKPELTPDAKPFALSDVLGIFQILFLSHITSLVVFVLEYVFNLRFKSYTEIICCRLRRFLSKRIMSYKTRPR